jgi:hypothetical protein
MTNKIYSIIFYIFCSYYLVMSIVREDKIDLILAISFAILATVITIKEKL